MPASPQIEPKLPSLGQATAQPQVSAERTEAGATLPIVRLVDLNKSFGRAAVLRGITLDFPAGQTTVVLGPSGCGKSVMLKHIIGLLKPDLGEVWFKDTRIDTLSEAKLVPIRTQFGVLFQQGALFDSMTVRQNVEFPLVEHTRLTPPQRAARVREVLGMVGMADALDKLPANLSGGQRKRVALARAIVLKPQVILYDEPTTGLDPIRSDVINELILRLQHELRISSIVVTHDLTSAFKIANLTVMLHEGKVVFRGTPDELRSSQDPIVQRFLKGEASDEEMAGIRNMSNGELSRLTDDSVPRDAL